MILRVFIKFYYIFLKYFFDMFNLIFVNFNLEGGVGSLIVFILQSDKLRFSKFMLGDGVSYEIV